MKSNRILQLILVGIIVIFVVMTGFLLSANSREVKRNGELNDAIAKNQAILNKGLAEKAAKEKEAITLASELASAKAMLNNTDFLASAESIEYDRILFTLANNAKLQVTGLKATPTTDRKEDKTVYRVTSFAISVEGKTPSALFKTSEDSTNYTNATVNSVLAFISSVVTGSDFDTAVIQSVNISAPKPMTSKEIEDMNTRIKDIIRGKLTDAEMENLTEEEITQLVDNKLATMTADQITLLIAQSGLAKPSAVITIEIWTYKGA